ncbi:PII uridylyl-transferase [Pasteurella multocida subsp. multocida str. Anand1_buffalo]|nr:PII uridylyl-transferase [Pasteurella multocida subsp. multocida str. Anand1_buffalo]
MTNSEDRALTAEQRQCLTQRLHEVLEPK